MENLFKFICTDTMNCIKSCVQPLWARTFAVTELCNIRAVKSNRTWRLIWIIWLSKFIIFARFENRCDGLSIEFELLARKSPPFPHSDDRPDFSVAKKKWNWFWSATNLHSIVDGQRYKWQSATRTRNETDSDARLRKQPILYDDSILVMSMWSISRLTCECVHIRAIDAAHHNHSTRPILALLRHLVRRVCSSSRSWSFVTPGVYSLRSE